MALFNSIRYEELWSMFLGVVYLSPLWESVCASMHMLMCHRSRLSDNRRCLQQSIWVSLLHSTNTWTLLHTWCLWALYGHTKRNYHNCKQTCTEMYMHWYGVTQLSYGRRGTWDYTAGCAGLGEEVNQAPTRFPSLVLDWVWSVTAKVDSSKIISYLLLKFHQQPIPLRNYLQILRLLYALCAVTFDWCIIRCRPPCFWALLEFPFFCCSALKRGSPPTTQTYRGAHREINVKTEREEQSKAQSLQVCSASVKWW